MKWTFFYHPKVDDSGLDPDSLAFDTGLELDSTV